MEFESIINELKQQQFKPVYFLQGEESYFIDTITDYIAQHAIDESERDFNQTILYGKEIDVIDIIDNAKRYPMMAPYNVVIIKEAQELSRTIDKLLDYIQNPVHTTILVINYKYKKLDGKTKMAKALKKQGFVFTSDKIRDYKLPDWVMSYGKEKGVEITPKAAILLSEFLGDDLNKIANTITKLNIITDQSKQIDERAVYHHVGISKEYTVFELQRALGMKDVGKANRIGNHFAQNPRNYPLVVTLGILYNFFSKLMKYTVLAGQISDREMASKIGVHPYFVQEYAKASKLYTLNKQARIIGYLRQYDLNAKGVGNTSVTDGELLKEMIYKVLH